MNVMALARELIAIPSHEDADEAGETIASWLRGETDAVVSRDEVGNVIARRGTGDSSLALVGHHDVVPPAPCQVSDGRYLVEEANGRLYGRGAADMKGSVAAAMVAFRDADPKCELVFASFVGEEIGGVGARFALEQGFAPEHAIICEGSTGYSEPDVTDVVIAHRGRREHRVTAIGEPVHAAEPDAGVNAIDRACVALATVRDLEPPVVEIAGERMIGCLTATGIRGGGAKNVVPGECEMTLDERSVPDEVWSLESLSTLAGIEREVVQETPAMRCSDAMFAGKALRSAAAAQEANPRHVIKPHATDAGHLAAAGTACVVIGASEPGEAHTDDESVSLAALDRCRQCYEHLAATWGEGGRETTA